MSPIVDVPLNTAIADLDEGLRGLLRTSLKRHGFDGVEISFDAPSREWSGKLTGPAVNLFLYDVREARDRATSSPESRDGVLVAPSLRLALTYAVTAWTKAGLPLVNAKKMPPHDKEGRTVWVTRARPKIDRIACPWLIRRFVDPSAIFLFVGPPEVQGVAERFGAAPFDIEGEDDPTPALSGAPSRRIETANYDTGGH